MAEDEKPKKVAKAATKKAAKPEADAKAAAAGAQAAEELKLERDAEEAGEAEAREPEGQPAKSEKPRPVKKAKKAAGAAASDKEAPADEGAREGKKRKARPRPRPKLDAALKKALALRREKDANRPEFHRQEWFRYQRLGTKWRAPQGIQSKMRRHWGTHADVVSIGHRGPKAARGLHPSGFREVLIHNADALEAVDPAKQAVRIASSVGRRKREEIQAGAKKLGIRVLNWRPY